MLPLLRQSRRSITRCADHAQLSRLFLTHLPQARRLWTQHVAQPSKLVQCYRSTSDDPVLNLSIEHYLLQKAPAESAVLFFYTNRPSVIIGRNQNPWLEVNLALLQAPRRDSDSLGPVELVRRRSGGGTVFHDAGNVNWTVISPSAAFTRDKHVEMVVRALRSLGIDRARVNERHDVVLDRASEVTNDPDSLDTHRTPYTMLQGGGSVKVSGSAYKLTRGRALHHGTCLLSTPNLDIIPDYLHSPAKPFIQAKGVESVSSPVGNIGLRNDDFCDAVRNQFLESYGGDGSEIAVGEDSKEEKLIANGIAEMKTTEWMWEQTPHFTIRNDESVANALPKSCSLSLEFRHGKITDAHISLSADPAKAQQEAERAKEILMSCGSAWLDRPSWAAVLDQVRLEETQSQQDLRSVADWLDIMLPTRKYLENTADRP